MSTMTMALLVGSVATLGVSILAWRRRERLLATAFGALTGLLAYEVSAFLVVAVVLCAATTMWHRRAQGASLVQRWAGGSRRRHGVASAFQILRRASGVAVRRKATTVRPSFRELSRGARARARTSEVGLLLCRVGALGVWASVEDVVRPGSRCHRLPHRLQNPVIDQRVPVNSLGLGAEHQAHLDIRVA